MQRMIVRFPLIALLLLSSAAASATPSLPKPLRDQAPSGEKEQIAVLSGGCFWSTEGVFEELAGVTNVISGYAGGTKETASYGKVSDMGTSHAESIQVHYDPSLISYGQLLQAFFSTHDPTTKDRQGADRGPQYRSAIFPQNAEQKAIAASYISQLEKAKVFDAPIVTTLEEGAFYPAEDYHQDYVRLHLDTSYVKAVALPKKAKLREKCPDLLKH